MSADPQIPTGAAFAWRVAAFYAALFVVLAWQLRRAGEAADRRAAHRLFAFSIVYLFVLFAALLASNSSNRRSSLPFARAALVDLGSAQADAVTRPLRTARGSTKLSADEV